MKPLLLHCDWPGRNGEEKLEKTSVEMAADLGMGYIQLGAFNVMRIEHYDICAT